MSHTAQGPASGYIFQFEIALIELASLKDQECISIEKLDDVSVQNEKGTYILTIQAKHSISSSGKSFSDTSTDLWKTIKIWINKIKEGELTRKSQFKAITNKAVAKKALVRKFSSCKLNDFINELEELLRAQKVKLEEKQKRGEKATTVRETINLIEYALLNKDSLEIIVDNFDLETNYVTKENFFNKIHLGTIENSTAKAEIFQSFLGWIIDKSKEFWCNRDSALFYKKDFDHRLVTIQDNHSLMKAVFRNKRDLKEICSFDPLSFKDDLFIKQIEDIPRNNEFKKEIISEAIMDKFLRDIELTHLIKNSPFTKAEFENFEKECKNRWRRIVRKHLRKNVADYSEDELNEIGLNIFDEVIYELKIDFQDYIEFSESNKYFKNGTFYNLSNIPIIGWHPEWEKRYKNDD